LEEIHALRQELKQKEKELAFLYQLHKSLASGYLEHLLGLIVNLTSELIHCRICSVMILDREKNELAVRATQSLDDEYLKKRPVKVDKSLSGLAILERRSIQTRDVTKEDLYTYKAMAHRLGLKSLLSVPMLVKTEPIGVINFYTTAPHRFSEEEIRFLEAIASQAAIAIEREELTREAEESRRALEERKTVERAKGILMEKKRLSERRAYELLRKASMTSRKSMREVAEAVILAEKL
jgi:signal transduction protein with GAF and PtsI domain